MDYHKTYKNLKSKMNSLFDEYINVHNCDLHGCIDDIYINNNFIDLPYNKMDYHEIFLSELKKVKFYLLDEELEIIDKGNKFLLINSKGYILIIVSQYYHRPLISDEFIQYTESELNYYPKDKDFKITLILPLQLYQFFNFEIGESRLDISTFSEYFIEVIKSVSSNELFEKYFNFMLTFESHNYFFRYNKDSLYYNLLKKNYNIELKNIIVELYSKRLLSLLEYIVCIELGYLPYSKDVILHIIFFTKKIDSFLSKKVNESSLSETSQKIITNNEVIEQINNLISSKEEFYKLFDLNKFVNSINFSFLNEIENYKKVFDFHNKQIFKISDVSSFINSFIPKEFNYKLKESPDRLVIRTGKYFFSNEDKRKFIITNVTNEVDDKILKNKVKIIIRDIENKIRIEKGYKVVGTFTNESILFVKLKEHFSDYKVISQGRPEWLGRQSLDIYFPEYNIGIEYQGIQHFKPVEYFGGQTTYIKRMLLDEQKKRFCKINNCHLIEVLPDYKIIDVINEIELIIQLRSLNKN